MGKLEAANTELAQFKKFKAYQDAVFQFRKKLREEPKNSRLRAQLAEAHVAGDLTQHAEVQSGGSYLAFSDLRVHFGLGSAGRVDSVEIRWQSGQVDRATQLPVNRRMIATEGEGIRQTGD